MIFTENLFKLLQNLRIVTILVNITLEGELFQVLVQHLQVLSQYLGVLSKDLQVLSR